MKPLLRRSSGDEGPWEPRPHLHCLRRGLQDQFNQPLVVATEVMPTPQGHDSDARAFQGQTGGVLFVGAMDARHGHAHAGNLGAPWGASYPLRHRASSKHGTRTLPCRTGPAGSRRRCERGRRRQAVHEEGQHVGAERVADEQDALLAARPPSSARRFAPGPWLRPPACEASSSSAGCSSRRPAPRRRRGPQPRSCRCRPSRRRR